MKIMELLNSQNLLLIILVIILLFVFGGCGLRCNNRSKERFYDQLRDQVSDPFFADDCGGCQGCQRYNMCNSSGYAKSMPLNDRGKPCPKKAYDTLLSTTCPECTTQPGRFT